MKVCFLGGVFDDSHNEEIMSKTHTYVEYAANNFQKKIIKGLKECNINMQILSAPFLGAYPKAYSEWYFKGFEKNVNDNSGYHYVEFMNIFGIRNFSRARAMEKALKSFIMEEDDEKLLIVYSPHTPFVQAANYAKKKDKRIKICLIVPDLPQYMNLAKKIPLIYKILKKYDLKMFKKYNKNVDSYIILTEAMKDELNIGDRPYRVIEGVYDGTANPIKINKDKRVKNIVYTGKLNKSFGIIDLVEAFENIKDNNLRLIICGSGEEQENIVKYALRDKRIEYKGQVESSVAKQYILEGDVLVNPRKNDCEYTKFSFPSKIIDYLSTGNPVVAYRLDGIPDRYNGFIHYAENDTVEALEQAIRNVLYGDQNECKNMSDCALKYLKSELEYKEVAKKIIDIGKK